ncbi:YbhB/YbcL family Raf kinase inhibitor-like protein [Streptomyces sp. NPDC046197]|uniref:YbhB/YbcL family Raf kinase inhibitor-like protein n=1 Tax=Streptomyces sp. NPDC046197 TaxID=3154337 RepID=UPI0033DBFDAA
MRRLVIVAAAAALGVLAGCTGEGGGSAVRTPTASGRITVSSPAFTEGGTIPRRYTCDGADLSPPLAFSGVPAHALGLVLLTEDNDAPHGPFTHWLAWDIDPHTARLSAGQAPPGATQGRNSFGKTGYNGPCPPRGKPHHYVFTLYAADRRLGLTRDATTADVKRALARHTLAVGSLTGHYGR